MMQAIITQVDRLLALTHASRLDQLDAAFLAVGKRLVVAVEDASASAPAPPRAVARSPG